MANSRRFITLDNEEIKKLLTRKMELIQDNKELSEQYQEIEKKVNKNNTEIQKVKDKVIPIIEAELEKHKDALGEFEMFVQSELEDGVPKMMIIDQVEEMKEFVRKNKEEAKKKLDENTAGDTMPGQDSSEGNEVSS